MADEKQEFNKTIDPSTFELLAVAEADGINTIFDRAAALKACPIGSAGACCKNCSQGPCRLTGKNEVGLCGATRATVAARNYARDVAGGAAAHSDRKSVV